MTNIEALYKEAVQVMRDYEKITCENMTPRERDHIWSVVHDPSMPSTTTIDCATGRSITKTEAALLIGVELSPDDNSISFGKTSHYNQYEGFEVVEICEQLRSFDDSGNFNRGNAFKYLARAGWKDRDKEVQDLEKAVNYLEREIKRIKARNGEA